MLPNYGAVAAALVRAMSSYFVGLLAKVGVTLPKWLYSATIFGVEDCCFLAVVFIAILCGINCWGTRESEKFNTWITMSKLGALIMIILVAFTQFKASNLSPFFIESQGLNGTVLATSIVFFGVLGFDFISTLSDEAINPKTDVPAAMRDTVVLTTVFYVGIAISMCGMGLGRQ
jgi:APA family basic amino acid/polyamine antiporter